MKCKYDNEFIQRYNNNDLGIDEISEFEEHLVKCSDCREAVEKDRVLLEYMEEGKEVIKSLENEYNADYSKKQSIMNNIDIEKYKRKSILLRIRELIQPKVAVPAIALLAVITVLMINPTFVSNLERFITGPNITNKPTGTIVIYNTPTEEPDPVIEYETIYGEYIGMIDSNSIEIVVNDSNKEQKPMALRLSKDLAGADVFEKYVNEKDIESGDYVKVEYSENEHGQYVMAKMEREVDKEAPRIFKKDLIINIEGKDVTIGMWDDEVDFENLLGSPLSEKIEIIGPGFDAFTGAFIKDLEFEGITFRLVSPQDDGERFSIAIITIKDPAYVTHRGIKTGDSVQKVLSLYPNNTVPEEKANYSLIYTYGYGTEIIFEIVDEKVDTIRIEAFYP